MNTETYTIGQTIKFLPVNAYMAAKFGTGPLQGEVTRRNKNSVTVFIGSGIVTVPFKFIVA